MKRLWIYCLPLLFLPSSGFSVATAYGDISISDVFIGPYLVLALIAIKPDQRLLVGRLVPVVAAFAIWALITVLLINPRYGYVSTEFMELSMFRLLKVGVYGMAGIFTARALASDVTARRSLNWALVVAALIVGLSLLRDQGLADPKLALASDAAYESGNVISVILAPILCYLIGMRLAGRMSGAWRHAADVAILVGVVGSLVTSGRGGWVGMAMGVLYIFCRRGPSVQTVGMTFGAVGILIASYFALPSFQDSVAAVFNPSEAYYGEYTGVGGIDDGARLQTWDHEAKKFLNSPLIGTGYYHRGGASGLWPTGSHNYWLQVFLETGLIGGSLVIWIFLRMWRQAGSSAAVQSGVSVAVKGSLIATFVVGLTESYLYDGMVLFTMLLIYAMVGSLPVSATEPAALAARRRPDVSPTSPVLSPS